MGSRRHLLPAIYNANLERFHSLFLVESTADHVKEEPIEGVIWFNDSEIIDLLDSDVEDNELNEGNQIGTKYPN